MTVNAILACDTEHGIGKNGGLPWPHNPADMKWFADNTRDGVVVMGRKTWDSLGNMRLKGRVNVVLSGDVASVKGNPDVAFSVGPHEMQKLLQNLEWTTLQRKSGLSVAEKSIAKLFHSVTTCT